MGKKRRGGGGGKRGLRLLIIHQNFPTQYKNIALRLAANPNNQVAAIGMADNLRNNDIIPGVALFGYPDPAASAADAGKADSDLRNRRATAARDVMRDLRGHGFVPDVILVHPSWGEGKYIAEIYPEVPVMAYAEWFPRIPDPLDSFDPEFPPPEIDAAERLARRDTLFADLAAATRLQTPTRFQMERVPESLREKTVLLHDGVDTAFFKPNSWATLKLESTERYFGPGNDPLPDFVPRREKSLILDAKNEVVTFFNRTLEPFRGWPTFARALPRIQKENPEAQVVVVGRTEGGYGHQPPEGGNWRDRMLEEIRDRVDFSRVHFLGNVPYAIIRKALNISRAHLYLTYPFVLSWSLTEAMSCQTPLIASNTEPVLEVIKPDETALTVDFFSPEEVADAVGRLLRDRDLGERLGRAGRRLVEERYDLAKVWGPRWEAEIRELAALRAGG